MKYYVVKLKITIDGKYEKTVSRLTVAREEREAIVKVITLECHCEDIELNNDNIVEDCGGVFLYEVKEVEEVDSDMGDKLQYLM